MSLRSLAGWILTLAVSLLWVPGCASLGGGGATSRASVPDPREDNPWFAEGRKNVARSSRWIAGQARARNVILFVGDGMGVSTVTAARILEGQRQGGAGEENVLAFEQLSQLALSKTYSVDAQVSDSASTMTAMMSGVKTYSRALGVDEAIRLGDHTSVEGARVLTLLEEAEMRGLATGIVSTATVTHATPAACYAHAPFRFWENDSRMSEEARADGFPDIARQLIEFEWGDGIEVALGGGRAHFTPKTVADPEYPDRFGRRLDGRDLTREWVENRDGSEYVWRRSQLESLDLGKTERLLGLFEPKNMKWETDRPEDVAGEPSLAEMTAAALEILSRDAEGYFLMVEAGRIDHAHHAGNAERALTDTIALSDAVRVALEVAEPRETLVIVTADHSHTLTIGGYSKRGNPILGLAAGMSLAGEEKEVLHRDALGLPFTTLTYANGPGYTGASKDQPEGSKSWGHQPCKSRSRNACDYDGIRAGRPDLTDVDTESPDFLQEALIPMAAETHAGEDVPIYAGGARSQLIHGVQEQHYIYHAMAEALGWTREGVPAN